VRRAQKIQVVSVGDVRHCPTVGTVLIDNRGRGGKEKWEKWMVAANTRELWRKKRRGRRRGAAGAE